MSQSQPLRIEVTSTATSPRSGNSKGTGRPYSFRIQSAYAHLPGKPYPQEIELLLDDSTAPHAPGFYVLGEDSHYVDRFKSLSVTPRLVRES